MPITEEMFADWLQHPVTEWVMDRMRRHAEAQKALWADAAWKGNLDKEFLAEARTRADCYLEIPEAKFEDWESLDDTDD